jgi:RNA polymerase sigma factor (sigma-70 family)
MRPREKEFKDMRAKMELTLRKKFYAVVSATIAKVGRKQFVEDLVSQTFVEAFRNSMNPAFDHYSCEELIKMKANNVWPDAYRKKKRTVQEVSLGTLTLEWLAGDRTEPEEVLPEKIQMALRHADPKSADIINKRLQGYEMQEIAEMYGCTPAALSQHLYRFGQKLANRSHNH